MLTGWLIYNKIDAEKNKAYIDWFIYEANQQNILLTLVLREELVIGIIDNRRTIRLGREAVNPPDIVIIRTIEPLLSLHLESCGSTAFNSSTISHICNDKARTHHYIKDLGVPMVDTLFTKKEYVQSSFPPMPYPLVVKEVAGRGGKQVHLVNDKQEWSQCISAISTDIIIQTCNVQRGKDIRIFVIGKEIIAAVLRESSSDFRSNFTLGGSARLYVLSEKEIATIMKIITHFDFDMVGIDFLIGLDGELLFNEIEDIVGSRTLSKLSDINILQKYVTHIKLKLKNSKKGFQF